jgi:site-specific recombinase XerC
MLGVESRLHWHVGREMFSTEFTSRSGNIMVLQKMMDHTKISATVKYVDANMKRAVILSLDALDEQQ